MPYLIYVDVNGEMDDFTIINCRDEEEAEIVGHDMAIDMVNSDPDLCAQVEQEAQQAMEYEGVIPNDPSDWLDNVFCDIVDEMSFVDVWQLKDNVNYDEVLKNTKDYKTIVKEYGI